MNGHSSGCSLANVEEPLDDAVARGGAIDEEQVFVLKAGVYELLGIVHPLVEPDNGGDAVAAEIAEVMVRGVQWVAVLYPAAVVGTSKCQKLAWKEKEREREKSSKDKISIIYSKYKAELLPLC